MHERAACMRSAKISVWPGYRWPAACIASLLSGAGGDGVHLARQTGVNGREDVSEGRFAAARVHPAGRDEVGVNLLQIENEGSGATPSRQRTKTF